MIASRLVLALLQHVHLDAPPLNPDGPTAQQWLRHELAKPEYQAAKPTWFDRLAQQISEWFSSLGGGIGGNAAWIIAGIGIALFAALLIAAFVIVGVPRLTRRRQSTAVFDAQDTRSADELRRRAASAAASGRYDEAVRELFRAIGRSLGDRTIVLVLPGTTAQELAAEASGALPAFSARLHEAATLFDGVRYLGRRAGDHDYTELLVLDRELAKVRPVFSVGAGVADGDPVAGSAAGSSTR